MWLEGKIRTVGRGEKTKQSEVMERNLRYRQIKKREYTVTKTRQGDCMYKKEGLIRKER